MTAKLGSLAPNLKYSRFDQLDGQHPWAEVMPEGCLLYPVRELSKGKVIYFNYNLAKEMGLLEVTHPHKLSPELEKKLLETFSIQIINEYDELTKKRYPPHTIKKNKYMATRYLQLQHANKKGRTSGDGRGIWNGTISFNGTIWDVSSRGTGVTALSPGSVLAKKPLKTGEGEYGYGCGLAEMDELLGAALFAEIMHLQGIPTERVLCLIDLGNGHGIGVRAAPNLLRPAHLFLYLKQNEHESLKKATHLFIQRQLENKKWKFNSGKNIWSQSLLKISESFGVFAAKLEADYIFAWLDWDGDNVLADSGIIDYGSIRQFGVCHDKYRYDDVERFSTTLKQQKSKALLIVQVFAQMFDYIQSGKKKNLSSFKNHLSISHFKKAFHQERISRFLYRLGFDSAARIELLKTKNLVHALHRFYHELETTKTHKHYKKVADGINIFPQYNMRKMILRFNTLIQENQKLHLGDVYKFALTQQGKRYGRKKVKTHFALFQRLFSIYKKSIMLTCDQGASTSNRKLNEFFARSQRLNSPLRLTGNALIEVVDVLWNKYKKTNSQLQTQESIDFLISLYKDMPETSTFNKHYTQYTSITSVPEVYSEIEKIILNHSEDI